MREGFETERYNRWARGAAIEGANRERDEMARGLAQRRLYDTLGDNFLGARWTPGDYQRLDDANRRIGVDRFGVSTKAAKKK